jgi:hypothetical protein
MKDHSLRFYVRAEALKEDAVIQQINSWPWVSIGQEGGESFLQITDDHLANLPGEYIPQGLNGLLHRIGTRKVSMKSLFKSRASKGSKELRDDGLYVVGKTRVSLKGGLWFMTIGDTWQAVIRAFKVVAYGYPVTLVIDQSDALLRKQIGRLTKVNQELRRYKGDSNLVHLDQERAIFDCKQERDQFKQERDEAKNDLAEFILWHETPWYERWLCTKPKVFKKFNI